MSARKPVSRVLEKVLYRGWLPVDDELDDSSEEASRLHLETMVAMVAVPQGAQLSNASMTDAWSGLISGLYALAVATQSAHWRSLGESFYGDHLMYQRMYDDVVHELDAVAEKFMGVVGDATILDPARLLTTVSAAVQQMVTPGDLAASLLIAQRNFLKRVCALTDVLHVSGQCTPGIENMLQGISDAHEKHVYLLLRRVGGDVLKACVRAV